MTTGLPRTFILVLMAAIPLTACVGTPEQALRGHEQTFSERQMQTRRFETSDELTMLAAAARVLQDFGFILDESETRLGMVVGSRRTALPRTALGFIPGKPGAKPKLRA